jgi:hypothetical protein
MREPFIWVWAAHDFSKCDDSAFCGLDGVEWGRSGGGGLGWAREGRRPGQSGVAGLVRPGGSWGSRVRRPAQAERRPTRHAAPSLPPPNPDARLHPLPNPRLPIHILFVKLSINKNPTWLLKRPDTSPYISAACLASLAMTVGLFLSIWALWYTHSWGQEKAEKRAGCGGARTGAARSAGGAAGEAGLRPGAGRPGHAIERWLGCRRAGRKAGKRVAPPRGLEPAPGRASASPSWCSTRG